MKHGRKASWKAQMFAQWRYIIVGLRFDGIFAAQLIALNQIVAHNYCSFVVSIDVLNTTSLLFLKMEI